MSESPSSANTGFVDTEEEAMPFTSPLAWPDPGTLGEESLEDIALGDPENPELPEADGSQTEDGA